jgi:Oxysterol-binding protein
VNPGHYKYLAEQVSHHPPITAYVIIGDAGFTKETVVLGKSRFTKGGLEFYNPYKEYINFPKYKERFVLQQVPISAHNLIIGTPYLDVSGKSYVRNTACPDEQYAEITFYKRNWSGDNNFRLSGKVFVAPDKVAYKIEG